MTEITVLGQSFCPWCIKAKKLLPKLRKKKGVIRASYFTLYQHYKSPKTRKRINRALFLKKGYDYIPIVIINDRFVGGYDALLKFYKNLK